MILESIERELASLREQGLLRKYVPQEEAADPACVMRAAKDYLDVAAGDPLDLLNSKQVLKSAVTTIETIGLSSKASRVATGLREFHLAAERRVASFLQQESSLLSSSRNQAYWTLANSLLREGDLVFIEENFRTPVIDAAEMLGASRMSFRFSDMKSFEEKLQASGNGRRIFVFSESIAGFSFSKLSLEWLNFFNTRPDCHLILDETHALAHSGLRGAGVLDTATETPLKPLAVVADFGRAFGLPLCGLGVPESLKTYICQHSRSINAEFMQCNPTLAAMTAAIDVCELATEKRQQLLELSGTLLQGLDSMGIPTAPFGSPYFALTFDSYAHTRQLRLALEEQGVLADSILSPVETARKGSVRLRLNLRMRSEHVSRLLNALDASLKRLKVKPSNTLLAPGTQL